jgi:hypothetical protein
MQFLKQSTAVDVVLGPFVDDTDGKTTEEALTLAQADLQLTKNGGAAAQKNDATSATHLYGGNYKVPLNTTDTNTLGCLTLMCKEAGALPVVAHFMVVTANWYDSMCSTDVLDVSVTQWTGTAVATPTVAGVPEVDITHIAGAAVSTTSAQLGVNVVNAAGTAWGSGAITAGVIATDAIGAAELAADAVAEIADAVWDEARAGHVAAGSFGEGVASVQGNVTGSVASVTGNVGGNVVGSVASVTGAVGSVTGNVGGNVVGSVGSVTGAVGSVTGNVGGNVTGSVGSVAAGGITAASIATDAIDGDAIAASAVTEIQSGLATAAALQTVDDNVDAILADTGTDGVVIASATQTAIADAILARDIGSGSNAGTLNERTVRSALRFLRNKWDISGTTLTVTKEDDINSAWTSEVTPDGTANPITGSNPTGP